MVVVTTCITRTLVVSEALRHLVNAVPALSADVELRMTDGPGVWASVCPGGSAKKRMIGAPMPSWRSLDYEGLAAVLRPLVASWVRELRRSKDWPRLRRESIKAKQETRQRFNALVGPLAPPYRRW